MQVHKLHIPVAWIPKKGEVTRLLEGRKTWPATIRGFPKVTPWIQHTRGRTTRNRRWRMKRKCGCRSRVRVPPQVVRDCPGSLEVVNASLFWRSGASKLLEDVVANPQPQNHGKFRNSDFPKPVESAEFAVGERRRPQQFGYRRWRKWRDERPGLGR